jgi:hypothetical protein
MSEADVMEWILIFLVIVATWVLFDVANKLHGIQKDVEVIKDRLQRMEERTNA